MQLKSNQQLYEELGRSDPLFAVLSDKRFSRNRWDVDDFFETGRDQIADVMRYIENLEVNLHKESAMDFGCGVGRLTQALCEEFDSVTGVDISSSMIESAQNYNQYGARCTYLVNTTDDLSLLDNGSFDFVYSKFVLQHIHPSVSSRYIAEFFRLLKPGGVALFQIPSGKSYATGSFGEAWYNLRKGALRRFWKRLRGKPPVEMHHIHHFRVKKIVNEAGGTMIEARKFGSAPTWPPRCSLRRASHRPALRWWTSRSQSRPHPGGCGRAGWSRQDRP